MDLNLNLNPLQKSDKVTQSTPAPGTVKSQLPKGGANADKIAGQKMPGPGQAIRKPSLSGSSRPSPPGTTADLGKFAAEAVAVAKAAANRSKTLPNPKRPVGSPNAPPLPSSPPPRVPRLLPPPLSSGPHSSRSAAPPTSGRTTPPVPQPPPRAKAAATAKPTAAPSAKKPKVDPRAAMSEAISTKIDSNTREIELLSKSGQQTRNADKIKELRQQNIFLLAEGRVIKMNATTPNAETDLAKAKELAQRNSLLNEGLFGRSGQKVADAIESKLFEGTPEEVIKRLNPKSALETNSLDAKNARIIANFDRIKEEGNKDNIVVENENRYLEFQNDLNEIDKKLAAALTAGEKGAASAKELQDQRNALVKDRDTALKANGGSSKDVEARLYEDPETRKFLSPEVIKRLSSRG